MFRYFLCSTLILYPFKAPAPNPALIKSDDILGVTVILLTCSFRNQEFIRVGYYVSNAYEDPEKMENPPSPPELHNLRRHILADKPRVTRFDIKWDGSEMEAASSAL